MPKVMNPALTISSLTSSIVFDLSKTYFVLSGIAGVNPKVATIGTVAFAKFAVQIDLQVEFDGREIPLTWSTGYVPNANVSNFTRILPSNYLQF
jgi:purine nucleoside permease